MEDCMIDDVERWAGLDPEPEDEDGSLYEWWDEELGPIYDLH